MKTEQKDKEKIVKTSFFHLIPNLASTLYLFKFYSFLSRLHYAVISCDQLNRQVEI